MKRTRIWRASLGRGGLLPALGLALWSAPGLAAEPEPLVEKLDHGEINWSSKTVIATGSGAPNTKLPNVAAIRLNAERAAKIDAYRNILEALKGLRITTGQLGGAALGDAQVRTQVEGVIQGCKTVDTRYYSDGGVDVVVRCPLDGGIATILAPAKQKKAVSTQGEARYTGLVIDAVGTKMAPALAPRVVDTNGKELYVQEMASPGALRQHGAVGWARSLEAAMSDPRIGKNPLVLRASGGEGDGAGRAGAEVIIGAEDAARLEGQNLTFLTEAKVVIATDGP